MRLSSELMHWDQELKAEYKKLSNFISAELKNNSRYIVCERNLLVVILLPAHNNKLQRYRLQ